MAEAERMTEASMFALLEHRLCKDSGNGPQTVLVPGVRSAAGFDSRRTIDAISLGLWPSRGMLLDGYEIKVSRGDWLRELKNPAKAEEFAGLVDRLWLVVADASIVKDGELPPGWGLLVRHGKQLREKVGAERLHDGKGLPPEFGRSFLVPLLRSANGVPPHERAKLREEAQSQVRGKAERDARDLAQLREHVARFEEGSGVKITNHTWESGDRSEERGRAFKVALSGEESVDRLRRDAAQIGRAASRLVVDANAIATAEADR